MAAAPSRIPNTFQESKMSCRALVHAVLQVLDSCIIRLLYAPNLIGAPLPIQVSCSTPAQVTVSSLPD